VYLLGFGVLYLVQERFIFLDDELPQDYQFEYDVPFEEFNLKGEKGGKLNALRFMVDDPKGVMLYFHGNRGNLTRWGDIVSSFTQYGYEVVVMDYRGFGKSTGKRNQSLLISDAQLFFDWCSERYGQERIVLYGRSLGTGLAAYLAGEFDVKHVILETPYYSLAEAAQRFYPIYPSKLALRYNFKSFEYLETARSPITIIHGTEDSVVPYEQGKALSAHLKEKNVSMVTIEGGEHRNLANYPEFWSEVSIILKD
jgi:fermentation-respiration switch protein FrsA (DUF1100 family)